MVNPAENIQNPTDRPARFEAVEAIRLGIEAVEEGRVKPAIQALKKLQEKLGIAD